MSTRYIKNRLSFLSSLASDYSRPREKDEWEKTYTTLTQSPYEPISCATTGTTITTPTTTSFFAVYNEDGTNYVTVAWTNNGTANQQRVAAGDFLYIPGATVANLTITANTAACVCRVVFGAA